MKVRILVLAAVLMSVALAVGGDAAVAWADTQTAKAGSEAVAAPDLLTSIMVGLSLLLGLLQGALQIVGVVYAIFFFFRYKNLRSFINRLAGAEVMAEEREIYIRYLVAAVIGAAVMISTMVEQSVGSGNVFQQVFWYAGLVCLAVWCWRNYKRIKAELGPKAAKWAVGCAVLEMAVIFALSMLTVFLVVAFILVCLFGKGLGHVADDYFEDPEKKQYRSQVEKAGLRQCGGCKNNGFSGTCPKAGSHVGFDDENAGDCPGFQPIG